MQFRFSAAAVEDLRTIALFTAERWGSRQADMYLDLLTEDCKLLLHLPLLGRWVFGSKAGLRRYRSRQHVVLYGVRDDVIEIIRVVHYSRKLPAQQLRKFDDEH